MMANCRTGGREQRAPAIQAKAERMINRLREHYGLGQEANGAEEAEGISTKDFADSHRMNEHFIRKLKRFAREYRLGDLKALRTPRPNGLPLHWGHVNYLLTIEDKTKREAVQERAIKEGWTAPQLYAEIGANRPPKDHSHGRAMQRPATLEAGLQQLTTEAAIWIRRCELVMIAFGRGRQRKPSEGLQRRAEEARDVLAKVEKAGREAAGELPKLLLR